MKEVITKILEIGEKQFKVPTLHYESLEEVGKATNDPNRALTLINAHLQNSQGSLNAKALIAACVEEISGDAGKDDKSDTAYVTRVLTAKPDIFDKVQSLVTSRARGYKDANGKDIPALAINAKAEKAKGRPAKLSDKWKTYALEFITGATVERMKDGKPKKYTRDLAVFNKKLLASLGESYTPIAGKPANDPANVEALGWLCKRYTEAKDPMAE